MKALATIFLVVICLVGCDDDRDNRCGCGEPNFAPALVNATPPFPGALAEIIADQDPSLGGKATLTFRYEFQWNEEFCDTAVLVAHGYFSRSYPGVFSYVSGESSWVDTVRCFEKREHSVIIRAERRGQLLLDGEVGARVDSLWSLGGSATVCICVR